MQRIWENARELRKNPADAEQHLWKYLRRRNLVGYKFRRQYPMAGYIADFACIEARLGIELDGGQHLEQVEYDEKRSDRLTANGYCVLRFWNDEVLLRTDDVLAEILQHLPAAYG